MPRFNLVGSCSSLLQNVTIRYFLLCLSLPYFSCAQPKDSKAPITELIGATHTYFSETPIIKEDIHSLLVSKNGQMLGQYYYNDFHPDSLNNVKSITKSIIGLLVGIAIEQELIKDVHQPMIDFFGDCENGTGFTEKKGITIEHLLMMQAGIQWNNRARIKDEWWFHETPNCFFLNHFPMDTTVVPGVKFSYNSAVAHLLSGIISRASGMTTKAFADKYLFKPLAIKDYVWEQDNAGEYRGNSELYLLPKDMLKIGHLLLNNGIFNGQSIIPSAWIKTSLAKAYDATPLMNYGYLWMTAKDRAPFFFFTGGSGGHHIFIVPDHQLVIVTTGHWDNARSTREIMQACVEKIIKGM